MNRVDRAIVAVALFALALAVHGLLTSNGSVARAAHATAEESSASSSPAGLASDATAANSPSPGDARTADLTSFLADLEAFRSQDAAVTRELEEVSERLCRVHRRCDVGHVFAYYRALDAASRRRGWEREAEFNALWSRVQSAREADLAPEDWAAERDEIAAELSALAAECELEPDFVPSARAKSLWARLAVERLRTDFELTAQSKIELATIARHQIDESLFLFQRAEHLTPQLEPLLLGGQLDYIAPDDDAATSAFQRCLALARQLGRTEFEANALQGLIKLAERDGADTEMERLIGELAKIRTPDEFWPLTLAHSNLLIARDEADVARDFLIRHAPADAREKREWSLSLGSALLRAGDSDGAHEQYWSALESSRDPDHPDPDLALALARFEFNAGEPERVLPLVQDDAFLSRLNARQRTQALSLIGEALEFVGRPRDAVGPLSAALDSFDERQLELEADGTARASGAALIGEVTGLHTLAILARVHAKLGNGIEAARVIEQYQSRSLRSAVSATRTTGSEARATLALTTGDLRQWASRFELGLVTWVIGADFSVVVHVAPDGSARAWPLERGRIAIAHAVRRLREAAIAGDVELVREIAGEIERELAPAPLWDRIAELSRSSADRLLFLLHGPLESLPVDLLQPWGAWIDERLSTVVLPGLPEADPGSTELPALARWALIGDPLGADGRSTLPGAAEEIAELAALHASAFVRSGARFDRSACEAALAGTDAIHVSTHLSHGCDRQSLHLSDVGLELSGGEVYCAADVRGMGHELSLAVLAACDTNAGRAVDAEGMQSLARAFLDANTRNVLVTLWPVEDQATRRLSIEFHRALLAGESPSRAAATARRELRHAGYAMAEWAAFRAIGRD